MCQLGSFEKLINVPKNKPITAYRVNRVVKNKEGKQHLVSLFIGSRNFEYWRTKVQKAHRTPTEFNSIHQVVRPVGIHSYSAKASAEERLRREAYFNKNQILVEIKIWGTVAVHKKGYRSEYCTVTKLHPSSDEHYLPNGKVRKYGKRL